MRTIFTTALSPLAWGGFQRQPKIFRQAGWVFHSTITRRSCTKWLHVGQQNRQRFDKHTRIEVAEVVGASNGVLSHHAKCEKIVATSSSGYDDAARVLGWHHTSSITAMCAELVDIASLLSDLESSEGEPDTNVQLIDDFRVELLEGLRRLRVVLDEASDGTLEESVKTLTFVEDEGDGGRADRGILVPDEPEIYQNLEVEFKGRAPEHAALLHRLAIEVVSADPAPKCHHQWAALSNAGKGAGTARVHNSADGAGKYVAYRCTVCGKLQRRYADVRER